MFTGHSKGLTLLFMTEMWERFSFYCMRALVVLYMTAHVLDGGLGWTKGEAISLYGMYMALAYITPIFGGYLSDRYLGQRNSAMIGAVMMMAGHFCMIFNSLSFFYSALLLVALGNGFFKPCMTSILGQLYDDADESARDSAYSIFYMGINIGAMIAGLVSGWMLTMYGYDWGFGAAGIGMTLALLIFWWGKEKYLGDAGLAPKQLDKKKQEEPLTQEEVSRLWVIFFMFLMTVFYFVAWEQMGGLVPLFIKESINRSFFGMEIPIPWLANLDPFFIVFLAPCLSLLWAWLGKRGKDPFVGIKMGMGFLFMAVSFLLLGYISAVVDSGVEDLPSWGWILGYKFLVVLGELCFIPISWAAVTKLSPSAWISRMVGLMLAGIGVGSWLAGQLGALVDVIGPTVIFYGLTGGMVAFGIICFMANPVIKRLAHV